MYTEQECETIVTCPKCGKQMYELKGALTPIYICSSCGESVDRKTLMQNKGEQPMIKGNGKKSLLLRLFPCQFMKKYTCFESFSDFIDQCNLFDESFDEISKEKITSLPKRKINRYVKKNTKFESWDQMFEKAVEWYLKM